MKGIITPVIQQTEAILAQPVYFHGGIHSVRSWKFAAVLFLYVIATACMMSDSFFGFEQFTYNQGVFSILTAIIILSAIAWEMYLLGPVSGGNFVLQILLICPLTLFYARILGNPSLQMADPAHATFLSGIWANITHFAQYVGFASIGEMIMGWIPTFIIDMFNHPATLIFLILILGTLCLKKAVKVPLLLTLTILTLIYSVNQSFSWWFAGGLTLMCIGLILQYCDYQKVIVYKNIIQRLRQSTHLDSLFLRTTLRLIDHIIREKRASEETVRAIVKSEYGKLHAYSARELKLMSGEIVQKLIYEHHILALTGDQNGMFLTLNPLMASYNSVLSGISIFPRIIFAILIAIFWAIMPIDLIPDAIPCIGMLDDMVVTILATFVLKSSWGTFKSNDL